MDSNNSEINVLYLEARTVTVKRTLVPNVEHLEFGEIPVAFKKVNNKLYHNNECICLDLRNFD